MLADILEQHTSHLSFVAQKPLIVKGRLNTVSRVDAKLQPIQGKQGGKTYNYILLGKGKVVPVVI
jgi:hypothetical protein